MYERFYGLKEKPFNLTPDPEFFFLADQHKQALEQVLYGVRRREGFTVLLGDVGTGKTTMCWALLGRLEGSVRTALVLNPMLTEEEILRAILQDFGVRPRLRGRQAASSAEDTPYDPSWMNGLTRKELIDELNAFLLEAAETGEFCVLILDEAQDLSVGVLEQLRLLSNLETAKKKLLQVIFVGQLEFERQLKHPQLRSLDQRISIRYQIRPLSRGDMEDYIRHRLKVAGASPRLAFSSGACRAIYAYSRGYPRLVNMVCDRSLLAGWSELSFRITEHMVKKAVHGLRGNVGNRHRRQPLRRIAFAAGVVLLLVTLAIVVFAYSRGALGLGPAAADPSHPEAGQTAAGVAGGLSEPTQPVEARLPAPPEAGRSAPATPPPAAPPASQTPRWVIQVHSLVTAAEAGSAVDELKALGYSAFSRQDGRWTVVLVGPFSSLDEAEDKFQALSRRPNTSPILRRSAPASD